MKLEEILEKLRKGEIDSEEAFRLLMQKRGAPEKVKARYESVKFEKKKEREKVKETYRLASDSLKIDLQKGSLKIDISPEKNVIELEGEGKWNFSEDSLEIVSGKFNLKLPILKRAEVTCNKGAIEGVLQSEVLALINNLGTMNLKGIKAEEIFLKNNLGSIGLEIKESPRSLEVKNSLGSVAIYLPCTYEGRIEIARKMGSVSISPRFRITATHFGNYQIGEKSDRYIYLEAKLGSIAVNCK